MNKKTLYILIILVLLVGAGIGMKEFLKRKSMGGEWRSVDVLKNIEIARVEEIEITKGAEKALVKQEEGGWRVEGKRVDEDRVRDALDAAREATFTGPVARTRENWDRMEVGDEGVKVTIRQGGTVYEFRVGKRGPTYDSSYVRLEGEDAVYVADKNLSYEFPHLAASWQSKRVVDIAPDQVMRIDYVRKGAVEKSLVKEGEAWMTVIGTVSTTTESAAMDKVLSALHPLTASEFALDEEVIAAFEKQAGNAHMMVVKGAVGDIGVLAFALMNGTWRVKSDAEEQIYELSEYTVKDLMVEE